MKQGDIQSFRQTDSHNYGLDFLKNLCMVFVVILHVLGQGGILSSLPECSIKYNVAWLLETFTYCAVDCFAMVTGCLMYEKKIKYRKLFLMWVVVVFYSLVISVSFYFLKLGDVGISNIAQSAAPVLLKTYWYFTAYAATFCFIPFMNLLIEKMSKRVHLHLVATIIILFSFTSLMPYPIPAPFTLSSGYSPFWLMSLYFIGAAIKKYDIANLISAPKALLGYCIFALISWGWKIMQGVVLKSGIPILSKLCSVNFIDYLSPTILACAICLLIFFIKLNFNYKMKRVLKCITPLSFQVYIIHENPIIIKTLIRNSFIGYLKYNSIYMIVFVLLTAIAIYTICIFIDWLRVKIFNLIGVKNLVDKLFDSGSSLLNKISKSSGFSKRNTP